MDLTFTEEQLLLKQSAERYLADRYGFAARQRHISQPYGWDRQVWSDFAEFGWLSLPFSEANGGLGRSGVELSILGHAFGSALVVEPYLPTVVLCGHLLEELGDETQRAGWLAPLMTGAMFFSLAHEEASGRHGPAPIATEARRSSGGWLIRGQKTLVLGGASADRFLVSTMLVDEGHATGLFVAPRDAAGLSIRPHEVLDGTRAAYLRLEDVAVTPLQRLNPQQAVGSAGRAAPTAGDRRNGVRTSIDRAVDHGMVFMAAYAAGAMRAALDATIAYTKTREQFGQPLAANQVIKHRLVDMSIACEEAAAIALRAALLGDHAAALAAKLKISRCARFVAEQSIQLHGGMGVTEELNVGAYFKSLLTFELLFGSPRRYGGSQFSHIRSRAAVEHQAGRAIARSAA